MAQDYRDISTAPRDGSMIEVFDPDCGAFPMRWNNAGSNALFQPDEIGIWEAPDGLMTWSEVLGCGPTLWRPLAAFTSAVGSTQSNVHGDAS